MQQPESDIWLRAAESGTLDLTKSEVWRTYPFPPIHDKLHPELGMLRAVDPKHSNQDFDITHPGGCAWELMRRPHSWRSPEIRSRLWRGFREMAHGIAAPVAHLKELLHEANAEVMQSLSLPLRFEPMLQWAEEPPYWKGAPTFIEDDPERWLADVRDVLSRWPGPLTLVLDHRSLLPTTRKSRGQWLDAVGALLSNPIPKLVGLELDLPGFDLANMAVGHFKPVRHFSLRGVIGANAFLAAFSDLDELCVREIAEMVTLPSARRVETDVETTARLPSRMEQLYLRGHDISRAMTLLEPVTHVRRLALDLGGMHWLFHPEDLAAVLRHLELEELAITEPWSLQTLDGDGDDAWVKCLRAVFECPNLRVLRLPWDADVESGEVERAIEALRGDVVWDRQRVVWRGTRGPIWPGWW